MDFMFKETAVKHISDTTYSVTFGVGTERFEVFVKEDFDNEEFENVQDFQVDTILIIKALEKFLNHLKEEINIHVLEG